MKCSHQYSDGKSRYTIVKLDKDGKAIEVCNACSHKRPFRKMTIKDRMVRHGSLGSY